MFDQTNPTIPATQPGGTPLSDHLPQQLSLSGQHYIDFVLDPQDFIATRTATQPAAHEEGQ